LDAGVISNGNLNMAPLTNAAPREKSATLGEHPAHRIERMDDPILYRLAVQNAVEVFQDGAIEKAKHPIRIWLSRRAAVAWHREPGSPLKPSERRVSPLDKF
jgi:hypothetical protein